MITSEKTIAINHPPAFMATTILKINNEHPHIKTEEDSSVLYEIIRGLSDFLRDIFVY